MLYRDASMPTGQEPTARAIPLAVGDNQFQTLDTKCDPWECDGVLYPVKTVDGNLVPIDQSRVLLMFALILTNLLGVKRINPTIDFVEHYLPAAAKVNIEV